ncbi:hypothetical protein FHS27_004562 [Rhodopirellula rubra]|uniref:Uncharacterized protein n=1 Tax=Aporhodopirellula rubra TaxID=980271 RepID=A0A7W5E204_9BACT|nr:hypothetical protein [Aporhodopirellula rubra]MBB3208730.1 hypothetical protein [Aporhodopirellula rubra]
MTPDDLAYLKLICLRPRMFYASARSFADVVAFISGVQCVPGGPHGGRFGTFPEFVVRQLNAPHDVPWTSSLIDAFSDIDMFDACEQLHQMLVEWGDTLRDSPP